MVPPIYSHEPSLAELRQRLAATLARREVQQYAEAAAQFETAAFRAQTLLQANMTLHRCRKMEDVGAALGV